MISVVIPHVPLSDKHDQSLKKCVDSMKADEVIVVVNDMIGFAKAVNQGLSLARGDFICVVNNDTKIVVGSLEELADNRGVTTPNVNGEWRSFGCFFCMPRWVYEKVGGLDERFETAYFEDNDFIRRLVINEVPIIHRGVLVEHTGGLTTKYIEDQVGLSDRNAELFKEKWGE